LNISFKLQNSNQQGQIDSHENPTLQGTLLTNNNSRPFLLLFVEENKRRLLLAAETIQVEPVVHELLASTL
jgi:hypothetical protein